MAFARGFSGNVRPPGTKVAPTTSAPTAMVSNVAAPEIEEAGFENTSPSVLLLGESGTGKTEAIASLIRAGRVVAVLDVEAKTQVLTRVAAETGVPLLVIPIAAPVKTGDGGLRRSTPTERYMRLRAFADALASGKYREHKGRAVSILAVDGVMEIAEIYKRHHITNVPRAESTGAKNMLAAYDNIGIEVVDFIKVLREAASSSAAAYGMAPMSVVATCGERWDGESRFVPILPGKQAAQALPYQFESVIRLEVGTDSDGVAVYRYHTTKQEAFYAKAPAGVLEPVIEGRADGKETPKFEEVYGKLLRYYTKAADAAEGGSE